MVQPKENQPEENFVFSDLDCDSELEYGVILKNLVLINSVESLKAEKGTSRNLGIQSRL